MPVGALTLAAVLVAAPSPALVGPVAPAPTVEVVAQASVPDSARKDVAASLAISPVTVRVRAFRIRQMVQRELRKICRMLEQPQRSNHS